MFLEARDRTKAQKCSGGQVQRFFCINMIDALRVQCVSGQGRELYLGKFGSSFLTPATRIKKNVYKYSTFLICGDISNLGVDLNKPDISYYTFASAQTIIV